MNRTSEGLMLSDSWMILILWGMSGWVWKSLIYGLTLGNQMDACYVDFLDSLMNKTPEGLILNNPWRRMPILWEIHGLTVGIQMDAAYLDFFDPWMNNLEFLFLGWRERLKDYDPWVDCHDYFSSVNSLDGIEMDVILIPLILGWIIYIYSG